MGLFGRRKRAKAETEAIGEALSRRGESALTTRQRSFTVGELEEALLREFPACDAESWDRTGLLVGERALPVTRVAVALDPTVGAIREASGAGAEVLLTHHPAYLEAPASFAPETSPTLSEGAAVWAAIAGRVALMDFHTALDVSPRAARVLPGMMGLLFKGAFVLPAEAAGKGYGQLCETVGDDGSPQTLGRLAARCTSVFGRQPRVWGAFDTPVRKVVTTTGSCGGVGRASVHAGADCLICGEVKYHEALELSAAGLCVIELGHDVSELPLVAILVDALVRVGFPKEGIIVLDQSGNWAYPEAVRL